MQAEWSRIPEDQSKGDTWKTLGSVVAAVGIVVLGMMPLLTLPWHYIGLAASLLGMILRRDPLHAFPLKLPILLFLAWLLVAALWAPYGREGYLDSFIYAMLFFILGWVVAQHEWMMRCLVWGVVAGITLSVGWAWVQFCYGFDPNADNRWLISDDGVRFRRASGLMSNPIRFGIISGLLALSLLFIGRRHLPLWILVPTLLLAFSGVILSGSRGPIISVGLAGLVSLAVFIADWRRILLLVLPSALALLAIGALFIWFTAHGRIEALLAGQDPRLIIWANVWEIIRTHPVTGVGPEGIKPAYTVLVEELGRPGPVRGHAHNSFLNIAATAGVPGMFLLVNMLGWIGWYVWRRRHANPYSWPLAVAALLMFIIGGMTEDMTGISMMRNPHLLFFGVAVGMASLSRASLPEHGPEKMSAQGQSPWPRVFS